MRTFKTFPALVLAIVALGVVGTTNASAAQFTASATGELSGKALTNQVLTTNGGTVSCSTAAMTGKLTSVASPEMEFTISYGGCTGFGFTGAEVSPATFNVTATGTAHLLNTVTIKIPIVGCDVTIKPQSFNLLNFTNTTGRIQLLFQLAHILYTSTGGLCGSSGENGTFTGKTEISRVGGGTLAWDA